MNEGATADKGQIRRVILARRNSMSDKDRLAASRAIANLIHQEESWRRARVVMSYASFASEVDTEPINSAVLQAGKELILPRVEKERGELSLYRVRDIEAELVPGPWGIREPNPRLCPPAEIGKLDLILVPGVAFDRAGGRIGYGQGFYDRFLWGLRERGLVPMTVGLAFFMQVVPVIYLESHDFCLHKVVTEHGCLGGKEQYCN